MSRRGAGALRLGGAIFVCSVVASTGCSGAVLVNRPTTSFNGVTTRTHSIRLTAEEGYGICLDLPRRDRRCDANPDLRGCSDQAHLEVTDARTVAFSDSVAYSVRLQGELPELGELQSRYSLRVLRLPRTARASWANAGVARTHDNERVINPREARQIRCADVEELKDRRRRDENDSGLRTSYPREVPVCRAEVLCGEHAWAVTVTLDPSSRPDGTRICQARSLLRGLRCVAEQAPLTDTLRSPDGASIGAELRLHPARVPCGTGLFDLRRLSSQGRLPRFSRDLVVTRGSLTALVAGVPSFPSVSPPDEPEAPDARAVAEEAGRESEEGNPEEGVEPEIEDEAGGETAAQEAAEHAESLAPGAALEAIEDGELAACDGGLSAARDAAWPRPIEIRRIVFPLITIIQPLSEPGEVGRVFGRVVGESMGRTRSFYEIPSPWADERQHYLYREDQLGSLRLDTYVPCGECSVADGVECSIADNDECSVADMSALSGSAIYWHPEYDWAVLAAGGLVWLPDHSEAGVQGHVDFLYRGSDAFAMGPSFAFTQVGTDTNIILGVDLGLDVSTFWRELTGGRDRSVQLIVGSRLGLSVISSSIGASSLRPGLDVNPYLELRLVRSQFYVPIRVDAGWSVGQATVPRVGTTLGVGGQWR